MSDYREYYLNNPHEIPAEDDDMEWLENAIEDEAEKDAFAVELLFDECVDYDVTKECLRAMFKAYCKRVHSTKPGDKEEADKDLLIFSKGLMAAMYTNAEEIITERGE
jgi:hypothetical protein